MSNNTKMKSIGILDHQIKALEYFISRCKKQHGLILNHYMGTGKTITGLTFLNNFPKEKKVIILPKGIEAVWKTEAKLLKVSLKTVTFIDFQALYEFENYKDIIEDSICVVDEAHSLYEIIEYLHTSEKIGNVSKDEKNKKVQINPRLITFIDMFYATKKIMLLSGTLVRHGDIEDLRWLINIAAGKEKSIVPFNENDFLNEFLKVSKTDQFFNNVFKPFFKINPLGIIPKEIAKEVNKLKDNSVVLAGSSLAMSQIIKSLKENLSGNYSIKDSQLGILDINRYKELLKNIKNVAIDTKTHQKILLLFILGRGITMIFRYTRAYYTENYDFNRLDIAKLKKKGVGKYFSYFNIENSSVSEYPEKKEIYRTVSYTREQLYLLLRLLSIPENLSNEELVDLELNNNIREAELFKDMYNIKSPSSFLKKGPIIGNLYDNPRKFSSILKMYQSSMGESTIVYSNYFESGILLFSKFLKLNNVEHTIYSHDLTDTQKIKTINDFKNKKITLLLLHPDFYQGFSVPGCRAFHILEPVVSSLKEEQLKARVVRYKSHHHLPKEERTVTIYQWGCTLFYDFNKALHAKILTSEWFKATDPYLSIFNLFSNFSDKLSPDDHIMKHHNKFNNFKKKLSSSIKSIGIDEEKNIPLTCCIWTPSKNCSDKSLDSCMKIETKNK